MKSLILKAQTGCPNAKQELANRLSDRLLSMARYYARCCGEDCDDLLGEAWVAVFEAVDVTDINIGQPDQYLLACARWRILDYVKWSKRRRHAAPEEAEEPVQSGDIPRETLDEIRVEQLVADLSETQQEVTDGLMKGLTWREVAKKLGCSSANIAYHVGRIREQLVDEVEVPVEAPAG